MPNNKFTANRTFNVPDLALEKKEADDIFQEHEEKRDQTWDEFLTMFTEHIEGKVDPNTRTAGRKDRDLMAPGTNTIEEEEDDEAQEVGRPKSTVTDSSNNRYNPVMEAKKFTIPDECHLEFLKLNKIESLGDEFVLVQHPYP
jgi:hypothetical protein